MRRLLLFTALVATVACNRQPSPTVFLDPALATLVPADTVLLAGVRMQQLTKTDFYQRYIAKGKLELVQRFKRETGLDPTKDLWEFLLASDGKSAVVLIRGKFSEHGFEPKLDRPGVERFAYKGYTMLGDEQGAVVFLNPTTAAAGSAPALRRLIDNRNSTTGIPPALQQRISRIPSTNQAWFVANTAGYVPARLEGPMANYASLFQAVQFATGQFDLREKLRGQVALECRADQEAEKMRGMLAGLLGMGRLSSPEERGETPQVFDHLQVFRERNVVRFSTDLTFEEIESSPLLRPLLGVK